MPTLPMTQFTHDNLILLFLIFFLSFKVWCVCVRVTCVLQVLRWAWIEAVFCETCHFMHDGWTEYIAYNAKTGVNESTTITKYIQHDDEKEPLTWRKKKKRRKSGRAVRRRKLALSRKRKTKRWEKLYCCDACNTEQGILNLCIV